MGLIDFKPCFNTQLSVICISKIGDIHIIINPVKLQSLTDLTFSAFGGIDTSIIFSPNVFSSVIFYISLKLKFWLFSLRKEFSDVCWQYSALKPFLIQQYPITCTNARYHSNNRPYSRTCHLTKH